ncbi:MAG: hypothetical protein JSW02_07275, partial [candidate division WOR-3 bacterium]
MHQDKKIIQKLERFLEKDEWEGWDPYDALNSRFLQFATFEKKWLRIAAIQLLKRSPVNLRPLLGVPKSRSPKALGLIARAYLLRYRKTGKNSSLEKARALLDWLIAHSAGYSGYSWGHHFNWQSSIFYIPKGIPTVVNTSFIAQAFLDAYDITKEKNYLSVARDACNFILCDLNRTQLESVNNVITDNPITDSFCFSYTPLDRTCVHNANMLAAELLARVYAYTKEQVLLDAARRATTFTLQHQNQDGSWYYGIGPRQLYIDNFHTGFVLVSLYHVLQNIKDTQDKRLTTALFKGFQYYRDTFFERNGASKYFKDNPYPRDLHCSAQGIITFLALRQYDRMSERYAEIITEWAMENMWDDRKG